MPLSGSESPDGVSDECWPIEDAMIYDGLFDRMVPGHMGITAENVAEKYGITRKR